MTVEATTGSSEVWPGLLKAIALINWQTKFTRIMHLEEPYQWVEWVVMYYHTEETILYQEEPGCPWEEDYLLGEVQEWGRLIKMDVIASFLMKDVG